MAALSVRSLTFTTLLASLSACGDSALLQADPGADAGADAASSSQSSSERPGVPREDAAVASAQSGAHDGAVATGSLPPARVDPSAWPTARFGVRRAGDSRSFSGRALPPAAEGLVTAAARSPDALVTFFLRASADDVFEARIRDDGSHAELALRRTSSVADRRSAELRAVSIAVPGGDLLWSSSDTRRFSLYVDLGDGSGFGIAADRQRFDGPDVDCQGSVACVDDTACGAGERCTGDGFGARCAACVDARFICGVSCGTATCTYGLAGTHGFPLCGVTAGPACTLGATYRIARHGEPAGERLVFVVAPPHGLSVQKLDARSPSDTAEGTPVCTRDLACDTEQYASAFDLHALLESAEASAAFAADAPTFGAPRGSDGDLIHVYRGDGKALRLGGPCLGAPGCRALTPWLSALADQIHGLIAENGTDLGQPGCAR